VEISLEDVVNEFRNRYPNEFTITMQALQIDKLQTLVKEQGEQISAQLAGLEPESPSEKPAPARKK